MDLNVFLSGSIHITAATYNLLIAGGTNADEWQATGGMEIKGKGNMQTFTWLHDEQSLASRASSEAAEAALKVLHRSVSNIRCFLLPSLFALLIHFIINYVAQ